MDKVIKTEDLKFNYVNHKIQLDNISIEVNKGEVVLLTGPSGCGKTTLIRCINGLIPHYFDGEHSGTIEILNKDSREFESWQFGYDMGCVFQNPKSQFFSSVVKDEITFSAENYGIDVKTILERRENIIKEFNLDYIADQLVLNLSSGEKQKLAFASAMIMNPKIYILDEPSANLDMASTLKLKEIIKKLKAKGYTFIIAEHRLYFLMDLVDKVYYIKDGKVNNEFSREEFKKVTLGKNNLGLRSQTSYLTIENDNKSDDKELVLELRDIKFSYKRDQNYILNNINFSAYKGDVIALVGSNGVGKTTLAKLLCGIIRENKGTVLYKNKVLRSNRRKRHIWFVMQETSCQLFSESVELELLMGKRKTEENIEISNQYLTDLGLETKKKAHPEALSGGEAQRLVFGVSMMQNSDIIIFDEPTSGLDGKNLERVCKFIKKLQNEGKVVIIITHDHELIAKSCSRILMIEDGKIELDKVLNQEIYDNLINKWES